MKMKYFHVVVSPFVDEIALSVVDLESMYPISLVNGRYSFIRQRLERRLLQRGGIAPHVSRGAI